MNQLETDTLIELTPIDKRAIRAFVQWLTQLEAEGKLELYDYQKSTLNKLMRASQ